MIITTCDTKVLFHFLGPVGSSSVSSMFSGNRGQELNGTLYWLNTLKQQKLKADELESRYKEKLDEKRNFWGFMFTLVSIFLFPIGFILGYAGMNFDDQVLLKENYFFGIFGLQFFGIEVCLACAGVILWMLDQKILYMGT
jgi:Mg2+ and Co2+ transporter CorA